MKTSVDSLVIFCTLTDVCSGLTVVAVVRFQTCLCWATCRTCWSWMHLTTNSQHCWTSVLPTTSRWSTCPSTWSQLYPISPCITTCRRSSLTVSFLSHLVNGCTWSSYIIVDYLHVKLAMRATDSLSSFMKQLKTLLFKRAFSL